MMPPRGVWRITRTPYSLECVEVKFLEVQKPTPLASFPGAPPAQGRERGG
jgi:hypothetical protein